MLSCLFRFYYGKTINKFFYIMKGSCHLVCSVKFVFKLYKTQTFHVTNEFVHFFIICFKVGIYVSRLFLQLNVT